MLPDSERFVNIHAHRQAGSPEEWVLTNLFAKDYPPDGDEEAQYSVGLHPWHIEGSDVSRILKKIKLATQNPKVFAIGDVVGPGLITDAIGAGRRAALNIDRIICGKNPDHGDILPQVDKKRISLEYYNPRNDAGNLTDCGADCASCGQCRDCGICVAVCPEGAIERVQIKNQAFEYKVDPDRCIGCGFCKGACPCGIWDMIPNAAL